MFITKLHRMTLYLLVGHALTPRLPFFFLSTGLEMLKVHKFSVNFTIGNQGIDLVLAIQFSSCIIE